MQKYLILFLCFIFHIHANPWEDPKYDGLRFQLPGKSFSVSFNEEPEVQSPKIKGSPINVERDLGFIATLFAHPVAAKFWEDGPVVRTEESDTALAKRLMRYQDRGAANLLSWWIFFVDEKPCGFVGAHRYLDEGDLKQKKFDDTGLLEVCYFMVPEFWGKKANGVLLSDLMLQAFSLAQLRDGLKDNYNTVYAPINPKNIYSVGYIQRHGFKKTKTKPEENRDIYSIPRTDLEAKMGAWAEQITINWSAD